VTVSLRVEALIRATIIQACSHAAGWSHSRGVRPAAPARRTPHAASAHHLVAASVVAARRTCRRAVCYLLRCAGLHQLVLGGTSQGRRDHADPLGIAARQAPQCPLHVAPSKRRQTTTVKEQRYSRRRCASAAPHNHNAKQCALGRRRIPGPERPCGDFCRCLGSGSGPMHR
jgi:hypothetical protein